MLAANTNGSKPIAITCTAWAWGFQDGAQGESLYTGYNYFCGCQFSQYEAGWHAGKAAMAAKRTATCGDPTLVAWQRDGQPVSGATWSGCYDGIDGHGEIRLTVASN